MKLTVALLGDISVPLIYNKKKKITILNFEANNDNNIKNKTQFEI